MMIWRKNEFEGESTPTSSWRFRFRNNDLDDSFILIKRENV